MGNCISARNESMQFRRIFDLSQYQYLILRLFVCSGKDRQDAYGRYHKTKVKQAMP